MAGFFNLFDYNKPGPGVRKDEPEKKGLARYFDIFGKRIWKMVALNFLYLLFSVVPYLILYAVCNISILFVMNYSTSPEEMTEWLNNGGTLLIMLGALYIYCFGGGGASACGMINVLRKYVDDTHAWVWMDFWSSFKDNFLQGTLAYIIDCAAAMVLIINFGLYNFTDFAGGNGILITVLRALLLLVILVWGMMHVYIYPVITSFKFKLRDVYKNSFIMVFGKLPQTAAAFILGGAVSFVIVSLTAVVPLIGLLIGIILFTLTEYTRLTISYPLIKKYMRDPEEAKREAKREAMRRDIEADAGVFNDDRVEPK